MGKRAGEAGGPRPPPRGPVRAAACILAPSRPAGNYTGLLGIRFPAIPTPLGALLHAPLRLPGGRDGVARSTISRRQYFCVIESVQVRDKPMIASLLLLSLTVPHRIDATPFLTGADPATQQALELTMEQIELVEMQTLYHASHPSLGVQRRRVRALEQVVSAMAQRGHKVDEKRLDAVLDALIEQARAELSAARKVLAPRIRVCPCWSCDCSPSGMWQRARADRLAPRPVPMTPARRAGELRGRSIVTHNLNAEHVRDPRAIHGSTLDRPPERQCVGEPERGQPADCQPHRSASGAEPLEGPACLADTPPPCSR